MTRRKIAVRKIMKRERVWRSAGQRMVQQGREEVHMIIDRLQKLNAEGGIYSKRQLEIINDKKRMTLDF